jgi:hypothetical protein
VVAAQEVRQVTLEQQYFWLRFWAFFFLPRSMRAQFRAARRRIKVRGDSRG